MLSEFPPWPSGTPPSIGTPSGSKCWRRRSTIVQLPDGLISVNWPNAIPATPSRWPPFQLAVDLAHEHVDRFEQKDGAIERRQGPAGAGGDHVEISADQSAGGGTAVAERCGRLIGLACDADRADTAEQRPERWAPLAVGCVTVVAAHSTMDGTPSSIAEQCKMQRGDVGKADKEFWVAAGGGEVEALGDAVGALAAPGCEDGPHGRIAQGVVEIGQALVVGTGEIVELVEGVATKIDPVTEVAEIIRTRLDLIARRRACWRDEADEIAGRSGAGKTMAVIRRRCRDSVTASETARDNRAGSCRAAPGTGG
jgi:hypothetical protein